MQTSVVEAMHLALDIDKGINHEEARSPLTSNEVQERIGGYLSKVAKKLEDANPEIINIYGPPIMTVKGNGTGEVSVSLVFADEVIVFIKIIEGIVLIAKPIGFTGGMRLTRVDEEDILEHINECVCHYFP